MESESRLNTTKKMWCMMIRLAWPLSLASRGFFLFFFLASRAVPAGSSSQDSLGTSSSSQLVLCHVHHAMMHIPTTSTLMPFNK